MQSANTKDLSSILGRLRLTQAFQIGDKVLTEHDFDHLGTVVYPEVDWDNVSITNLLSGNAYIGYPSAQSGYLFAVNGASLLNGPVTVNTGDLRVADGTLYGQALDVGDGPITGGHLTVDTIRAETVGVDNTLTAREAHIENLTVTSSFNVPADIIKLQYDSPVFTGEMTAQSLHLSDELYATTVETDTLVAKNITCSNTLTAEKGVFCSITAETDANITFPDGFMLGTTKYDATGITAESPYVIRSPGQYGLQVLNTADLDVESQYPLAVRATGNGADTSEWALVSSDGEMGLFAYATGTDPSTGTDSSVQSIYFKMDPEDWPFPSLNIAESSSDTYFSLSPTRLTTTASKFTVAANTAFVNNVTMSGNVSVTGGLKVHGDFQAYSIGINMLTTYDGSIIATIDSSFITFPNKVLTRKGFYVQDDDRFRYYTTLGQTDYAVGQKTAAQVRDYYNNFMAFFKDDTFQGSIQTDWATTRHMQYMSTQDTQFYTSYTGWGVTNTITSDNAQLALTLSGTTGTFGSKMTSPEVATDTITAINESSTITVSSATAFQATSGNYFGSGSNNWMTFPCSFVNGAALTSDSVGYAIGIFDGTQYSGSIRGNEKALEIGSRVSISFYAEDQSNSSSTGPGRGSLVATLNGSAATFTVAMATPLITAQTIVGGSLSASATALTSRLTLGDASGAHIAMYNSGDSTLQSVIKGDQWHSAGGLSFYTNFVRGTSDTTYTAASETLALQLTSGGGASVANGAFTVTPTAITASVPMTVSKSLVLGTSFPDATASAMLTNDYIGPPSLVVSNGMVIGQTAAQNFMAIYAQDSDNSLTFDGGLDVHFKAQVFVDNDFYVDGRISAQQIRYGDTAIIDFGSSGMVVHGNTQTSSLSLNNIQDSVVYLSATPNAVSITPDTSFRGSVSVTGTLVSGSLTATSSDVSVSGIVTATHFRSTGVTNTWYGFAVRTDMFRGVGIYDTDQYRGSIDSNQSGINVSSAGTFHLFTGATDGVMGSGTLLVDANATLVQINPALQVNGDLTVNGVSTFSGAVTMATGLNVTGDSSVTGILTATKFRGAGITNTYYGISTRTGAFRGIGLYDTATYRGSIDSNQSGINVSSAGRFCVFTGASDGAVGSGTLLVDANATLVQINPALQVNGDVSVEDVLTAKTVRATNFISDGLDADIPYNVAFDYGESGLALYSSGAFTGYLKSNVDELSVSTITSSFTIMTSLQADGDDDPGYQAAVIGDGSTVFYIKGNETLVITSSSVTSEVPFVVTATGTRFGTNSSRWINSFRAVVTNTAAVSNGVPMALGIFSGNYTYSGNISGNGSDLNISAWSSVSIYTGQDKNDANTGPTQGTLVANFGTSYNRLPGKTIFGTSTITPPSNWLPVCPNHVYAGDDDYKVFENFYSGSNGNYVGSIGTNTDGIALASYGALTIAANLGNASPVTNESMTTNTVASFTNSTITLSKPTTFTQQASFSSGFKAICPAYFPGAADYSIFAPTNTNIVIKDVSGGFFTFYYGSRSVGWMGTGGNTGPFLIQGNSGVSLYDGGYIDATRKYTSGTLVLSATTSAVTAYSRLVSSSSGNVFGATTSTWTSAFTTNVANTTALTSDSVDLGIGIFSADNVYSGSISGNGATSLDISSSGALKIYGGQGANSANTGPTQGSLLATMATTGVTLQTPLTVASAGSIFGTSALTTVWEMSGFSSAFENATAVAVDTVGMALGIFDGSEYSGGIRGNSSTSLDISAAGSLNIYVAQTGNGANTGPTKGTRVANFATTYNRIPGKTIFGTTSTPPEAWIPICPNHIYAGNDAYLTFETFYSAANKYVGSVATNTDGLALASYSSLTIATNLGNASPPTNASMQSNTVATFNSSGPTFTGTLRVPYIVTGSSIVSTSNYNIKIQTNGYLGLAIYDSSNFRGAIDSRGNSGGLRINSSSNVDICTNMSDGANGSNIVATFANTGITFTKGLQIQGSFNYSPTQNYYYIAPTGNTGTSTDTSARAIGLQVSYRAWFGMEAQFASDRRLKTEIVDYTQEEAIALIKSLKPVSYKWKKDVAEQGSANVRKEIGFIAQDVAEVTRTLGYNFVDVVPENNTNKEYLTEEDGFAAGESGSLNYKTIHNTLIPVIQNILNRLDIIEDRLAQM